MPKRKPTPSSNASGSKAAKIKDKAEAEEDVAQEQPAASPQDSDFPSEGSSEGSESADDSDGEAFESVDVDFEFYDPTDEDFHGLKTLLTPYLDGQQYECSELAEAIIAGPVGSVIKCGQEEDPIGFATVLPLHGAAPLKALAELKAFVKEHCPAGMREQLGRAWAAKGTGLLLSERLLNCPPQLAPPLMDSVFEEAAAAGKDAGQEYTQYIFLTRAYLDPTAGAAAAAAGGAGSSGAGKKPKKKKGKKAAAAEEEEAVFAGPAVQDLIFATPEGEFLCSHAKLAFAFTVPNRAVGKDDLVPHRVVAVVEAGEAAAALKEMKEVVEGGAAAV